ncbi:hypothetical protein ACIO1C_21230 [Streptomyces sp. NPDC087420]|uniref:hypothetical protein n=1 Tax=Streptomyces sp. NPDC087420 TaxID=3365785 RepID=UPI003836CD08
MTIVPEAAEFVGRLEEQDENGRAELFPLLREGFAEPLVLPALKSPAGREELLTRCFSCVDLGLRSPDTSLNDAIWFQVLEPLLDSAELLDAPYPFMTDDTRDYVFEKLEGFGVLLPPRWAAGKAASVARTSRC